MVDHADVRARACKVVGQRRGAIGAAVVDDEDLAVTREADRGKLRLRLGHDRGEARDLVVRRDRHGDPHPGSLGTAGRPKVSDSGGDGQLRP